MIENHQVIGEYYADNPAEPPVIKCACACACGKLCEDDAPDPDAEWFYDADHRWKEYMRRGWIEEAMEIVR